MGSVLSARPASVTIWRRITCAQSSVRQHGDAVLLARGEGATPALEALGRGDALVPVQGHHCCATGRQDIPSGPAPWDPTLCGYSAPLNALRDVGAHHALLQHVNARSVLNAALWRKMSRHRGALDLWLNHGVFTGERRSADPGRSPCHHPRTCRWVDTQRNTVRGGLPGSRSRILHPRGSPDLPPSERGRIGGLGTEARVVIGKGLADTRHVVDY